jgi:hypothetical protein
MGQKDASTNQPATPMMRHIVSPRKQPGVLYACGFEGSLVSGHQAEPSQQYQDR